MAKTLTQSLDSVHDQYKKQAPNWEKTRDCIEGQEAIHHKGTKYLPMLSNQSWTEYENYRDRAMFFNATQRVHEALVGLLFAKEPKIESAKNLEPVVDDVTLGGENLYSFMRRVTEEVMATNRAGVLVDFPQNISQTPLTVAQAEAMNLRPYLTMYVAEDVMDWRVSRVGNVMKLTFLKLREWNAVIGDNEFEEVHVERRRVLDFDEMGFYRVRLYERNVDGEFELVDDVTPTKNGAPLTDIPFFIFSSKSSAYDAQKPVLLDLANVNISHYKSTADLEHGLHYTGLPTAVIIGYEAQAMDFGDDTGDQDLTLKQRSDRAKGMVDDTPEFSIGSGRAWVLPNSDAKVQYLEFQGQGLTQLSSALEKKEQQMAKLGARILQTEKNAAESGEALGIRRHAETSVLASVAESITNTAQKMLDSLCDWAGYTSITITMNLDFIATKMTPEELTANVNAWLQGAMSKESLFDALVKGEVLSGARTFEEEQDLIDTERSSMVGGTMDLTDPNADPNANPDNAGDALNGNQDQ